MNGVFQNHNSRTCVAFDMTKERVRFVISEEGQTSVRSLPTREFEREWSELPTYPVVRAARLFLNPISAAIEISEEARHALQRIINSHNEDTSAMSNIEVSTTQGQKNVNATVAAGLKTGTKGGDVKRAAAIENAKPTKEPASPAPTKAPSKSTAKPAKSTKEKTVSKTATKKTAAAKTATKAATKKPATKGGAAKLVKGKKAAPAKANRKAAGAKRGGGTPFASKQDQKIKQAPNANVRSGAMKDLFDFVGKKGCTRAEAIAHMVKKDKEEGAEQRAKNNISWGLRHEVFVEG